MTSLSWLSLGAKTFLKPTTRYTNFGVKIFTRKIHHTKVVITRPILKGIPRNAVTGAPYLKRGLATITTIDAKDIKQDLTTVTAVDAKDTETVRSESMEAGDIMQKKREYRAKNYIQRINFELLEDFPAWLDGLGMRILAPLFEGKTWQDVIRLSPFDLKAMGIHHANLRERLLRHFKRVREQAAAANGIDVVPTNNVGYDVTSDLECHLHSLDDGLGHFAPFFGGREWREIVKMSDKDLKKLGIKSRLMRQKLIKNFKLSLRTSVDAVYEKNQPIYERHKAYHERNYIVNINFELLEDFSAWLDGLGLKSLGPYFEGKRWQEIVNLREQDLEEMGISNIHHKKRLVRHFRIVQQDSADQENTSPLDENGTENHSATEDIENFKVDPKIREDVPCWLNSLGDGLGDYSLYFQDKKWYEIVDLSDQSLEELGIKRGDIRRQLIDGFLFYKGAMNNKEAEDAFLKIKDYYKENYITTNYELLEDFPAWLDGLGLKVLAPHFGGRAWRDIINMTCSDLEEIGIPTKSLRKRLVRHFIKVQNNLNMVDSLPEEDRTERIIDSGIFVVDYEVMGDLACWLHSIDDELGKIAPFLMGKKWQEVIDMGHKELLELGIRSRKMRRMLLEGFDMYKKSIAAEEQESQATKSDFILNDGRIKEVSATL